MSASLVFSEFVFESGVGSQSYRFTVAVDQMGKVSVRNIQNPFGLVMDPWSQIPQSVTQDICTATAQVENILATTSAVNGTLTFVGEVSKTFTFASPFADTNYRVQLSSDTFVPLRVISKTLVGFTVEAAASFTGTVGFDVFV